MSKYDYLYHEPGPKMLIEALGLVGITEIVGKVNNPVIVSWAKEFGIEKIYPDDETPWCSLAHAIVAKRAGKVVPYKNYELLRAKSWASWGVPVNEAMLGDTLVFERQGGGHVGLYVGETEKNYIVLGGNQSNRYGFTEISKERCIARRRPVYEVKPTNIRKILLSSSGQISVNEK